MSTLAPERLVRLDPHGAAMLDFLAGSYDGSFCYVRDDGYAAPLDIAVRFAGYPDFSAVEKAACKLAWGRVLDVGCGSGKHLAWLRASNLRCAGVDSSLVVMEVLRRRGIVGVCQMDALRLGFLPGSFDTVTLFANGLSMGGSVPGMRQILAESHRVTGPAGRIVVTNVDVRRSPHRHDHRYHRANLAAGKLPGQLTLRCRYRGVDGRAFAWLLVSPAELTAVVAGSGWRVAAVESQPGGAYCARLDKDD